MHVLFVTENRFDRLNSGDGSTRYRCFNVAEALLAAGHRVTVAGLAEVMPDFLGHIDVISVLRPRAGARLKRLVDAADALGIHLVADFDDLIFDVQAAGESPLVLNQFATEKTVARGFQKFADAARWFSEITVATVPLAEAAQRCFKDIPVHLLPNGLSPLWLQHADAVAASNTVPYSSFNTISYMPGTRSHDADFRSVQDAVANWLAADKDRQLKIVGALTVDDMPVAARQVTFEPLVPYFKLPEKIRSAGVSLAPLVKNTFNEAKSHIKFLESAAFGVPVIATPIADIKQHLPVAGLNGPVTADEWLDAIKSTTDASGDHDLCERLKRYVRENWTSVETSHTAILRWQSHTKATNTCRGRSSSPCESEQFFLSLRPVPQCYTKNGWRPDFATNTIVAEAESSLEFEQWDSAALEQRVGECGAVNDQWRVLVHPNAGSKEREIWKQRVSTWRPAAAHIDVIHARSVADWYSLVFHSDHTVWISSQTPALRPSLARTLTEIEVWQIKIDRWRRKARKFRESPVRFLVDSRAVKLWRKHITEC